MAYNQNYSQRDSDRVRYELIERIGVLGIKDNGWTKEVNIVSWNGGAGKVDIRDWDPSHARMAKGITMMEEEAEKLAKVLAKRYGIGSNQDGQRSSYSRPGSAGYRSTGNSGLYDVAESDSFGHEDRAFNSGGYAHDGGTAGSSVTAMDEQAQDDADFEQTGGADFEQAEEAASECPAEDAAADTEENTVFS